MESVTALRMALLSLNARLAMQSGVSTAGRNGTQEKLVMLLLVAETRPICLRSYGPISSSSVQVAEHHRSWLQDVP